MWWKALLLGWMKTLLLGSVNTLLLCGGRHCIQVELTRHLTASQGGENTASGVQYTASKGLGEALSLFLEVVKTLLLGWRKTLLLGLVKTLL